MPVCDAKPLIIIIDYLKKEVILKEINSIIIKVIVKVFINRFYYYYFLLNIIILNKEI